MNFKLVAALGGLIAGAVTSLKNTFDTKAPAQDEPPTPVQAQNCCAPISFGHNNDLDYIYAFKSIIVDYRQIFYISRGSNDNAFVNFHDGSRPPVDTGEKFDEVRTQILGD